MEVKANQMVTLWDGRRGHVHEVISNKAHVILSTGRREFIAFDQITAAVDTYSEKDAKFLQAKDKLQAFKQAANKTAGMSTTEFSQQYGLYVSRPIGSEAPEWIALGSSADGSKFAVTFEGKEASALGVTYPMYGIVYAADEEAAKLKLYDKYDRIKAFTAKKVEETTAAKAAVDTDEKGIVPSKCDKTAAHPNEYAIKYPAGTILVQDGKVEEFIHVLDYVPDTKNYILTKRQVAADQAEGKLQGVRYESPAKTVDSDKSLRVFSGIAVDAGKPSDLVATAKMGENVKLSFKEFDAVYTPEGILASTTATPKQFSKEYRKEFGLMVKNMGFDKISSMVLQKRLASKLHMAGTKSLEELAEYIPGFYREYLEYAHSEGTPLKQNEIQYFINSELQKITDAPEYTKAWLAQAIQKAVLDKDSLKKMYSNKGKTAFCIA